MYRKRRKINTFTKGKCNTKIAEVEECRIQLDNADILKERTRMTIRLDWTSINSLNNKYQLL
jgi:hypothetical protein